MKVSVRRAAALGSAALLLFAALSLGGCSTLQPIAPPAGGVPVQKLSQLGLFAGAPASQKPGARLLAYDVNASLFVDGATKRRFIYVPEGARVEPTVDRWDIPVGAYLVKTFSFPRDFRDPAQGERLVETRFLVRTAEGFTASTYVWNEAQTDAIASSGNVDVPISFIDRQGTRRDRVFHIPDASQCAACHQGRALGWRSRQLDHTAEYADGTHDQIAHFRVAGLITHAPPPHLLLVDPRGSAALGLRARSYLDVNCSHCHGSGGIAEGTRLFWDLEHTAGAELPTCRPTPDVDGRDRVLIPGHPDQSEFLARMRSSNPRVHMPRGPAREIDRTGVDLLSQWVASFPPTACER